MFSATYYNISAVKWWSSFYNGGDRRTKSKQSNDMLLAEFVCYDMHQIIVFDIQYALNIYQYSGYYLEIKFFLYIHYLPYNCGKQNIRPQVFLTAHCMHTQCTVMPQYPVYIHAYTVYIYAYPVHICVYLLVDNYAYPVHICALPSARLCLSIQCMFMYTHCTSMPTQCMFAHNSCLHSVHSCIHTARLYLPSAILCTFMSTMCTFILT